MTGKIKKILITGGTGFIGSRLALDCLDRGECVRVLGQTNNAREVSSAQVIRESGGEVIVGTVTDSEEVGGAVSGVDLVYHLAAAQHEANVGDQVFRDVNVIGTRNVMEACVRSGVRRVVHGSTIGVFGGERGQVVGDESPLVPTNIYGVTKLEAERVVEGYRDRLSVATVRISETYGPGDGRLLKLFRGLLRKRLFLIGDGKNLHHPIYIDDLIAGLRLSAEANGSTQEPFVLAGPSAISTKEMIAGVAMALGKRAPWFRCPMWPFMGLAVVMEGTLGRMGLQPPLHRRRLNFFSLSFSFSCERARACIGFSPGIEFGDGAARTARWYQETGQL